MGISHREWWWFIGWWLTLEFPIGKKSGSKFLLNFFLNTRFYLRKWKKIRKIFFSPKIFLFFLWDFSMGWVYGTLSWGMMMIDFLVVGDDWLVGDWWWWIDWNMHFRWHFRVRALWEFNMGFLTWGLPIGNDDDWLIGGEHGNLP